MVSHASHMESLTRRLDHKLAIYNDDEQILEPLKPLEATEDLHPRGHSFEGTLEGQRYFYFASPYPLLRERPEGPLVKGTKDPHPRRLLILQSETSSLL